MGFFSFLFLLPASHVLLFSLLLGQCLFTVHFSRVLPAPASHSGKGETHWRKAVETELKWDSTKRMFENSNFITIMGFCCCVTTFGCVWYLSFVSRILMGIGEGSLEQNNCHDFIMKGVACIHRRLGYLVTLFIRNEWLLSFSVNILSVLSSELYFQAITVSAKYHPMFCVALCQLHCFVECEILHKDANCNNLFLSWLPLGFKPCVEWNILHSVQMPDTMQVMEANCMCIQILFNFMCCFCFSA